MKLGNKAGEDTQEGILGQARRRAAESQGGENVSPIDPRLTRLQIVSIDRVIAGRYQTREDEEGSESQLEKQIRLDLQTHETLEHVFIVSVNQKNPSQFALKRGGHRRLKIARKLGVREIYIWVEEHNLEESARGTYFENNGRNALNIIEEGKMFRLVQEDAEWTQTEIAERFSVPGGQPHVARAIKAASYPETLQYMIFQDVERGMRAAEKLFSLSEKFGLEKAEELWKPLITAFLSKDPKTRLSTDGIQIAVDMLLTGKLSDTTNAPLSTEKIRLIQHTKSTRNSFQRYKKELGLNQPSSQDREELLALREEIDAILSR